MTSPSYRTSKRAFDIVASLIFLVLLIPIFGAISILIWLDDGRPFIFKQSRIGRKGEKFKIYKFRKLKHSSPNIEFLLTKSDDTRYTRIGKFLEMTKLNELPQLLNVIKGDMSLVGPRPEIVNFGHCYKNTYASLLKFTPGIFGPSQYIYRFEAYMYPTHCEPTAFYENVLFPQKAEIDIDYYRVATFTGDLYWIYQCIISILMPKRVMSYKRARIPRLNAGK